MDTKIVVLHRGWVVVGKFQNNGDSECIISDASVIRCWGTTKGLGELALNGPTNSTILDFAGTVRCHPLAVVLIIDCVADKW